MPFPACVAVIEQVPEATVVMSNPETVQTPVVLLVSVTTNDDEAVAAEAKVTDGALVNGFAKVIV